MRKVELEEVNAVRALAYLLSDWRIGVAGGALMSSIRSVTKDAGELFVGKRRKRSVEAEIYQVRLSWIRNPIRTANRRGYH